MVTKYEKEAITVLSDIEHIQTRPGMYIGELEDPRQLLSEAIDNALDEIQSGHSKSAIVKVNIKTNEYEVTDLGRGIPLGKINNTEVVELLSTKAFSGSKFDNIIYRISAGLNGVGIVCINALSENFSLTTRRKKKFVTYVSGDGKHVDLIKGTTNELDGVTLKFKANPKIFNTLEIPISYIKNRCGIAKAFGFDLKFYEDDKEIDFGVTDIFDLLPKDDSTEFCRHRFLVKNDSGETAEVAFIYTSEVNTKYNCYTNLIYNPDGGTHLKVFENAVKEAWGKYLPKDFIFNDCLVGLRAVVSVFLSNPEFSSQTKNKLTANKKYVEDLFKDDIIKEVNKFLSKNENIKKGLIKRFNDYRESQNKLLAKKQINKLIILGEGDNGYVRRKSVVPKLIECTSKSRVNTELIITEGDSAAGSAILCRDMKYQALLPIRGKILNVAKIEKPHDCLANEEVKNIVNAIGSGFLSSCDANKSRYEKIVLNCDADPDGKNIAALLIALFVNLLPDLVKEKMIELIIPPLYGWKEGADYKFTDEITDIPEKVKATRYKGLGEMDPDELYISCINPQTRKSLTVNYPTDIEKFNKIMTSASAKFDILKDLGVIIYS